MAHSIFYAWQSDRDQDLNRWFIRDAAKAALKKLASEADIEDAPVLDHDTKDVPGIPHIADTIKRKITQCAVFLADVTHVAEFKTADGRTKHAQNGNVLVELGIALNAKGTDRILLVMNDSFGPPSELPFDLRHHSFPIQYTLPDGSGKDAIKAERTKVADRLAAAFKLIMLDIVAKEAAEKDRVDAASLAVLQEKARSRREEFEEQVRRDRFYRFRGRAGVMALSIIPLATAVKPINLAQFETSQRLPLVPFGGSGWDYDHHADSFAMYDVRGRRDGEKVSGSVTAITAEGAILSADQMRSWPGDGQDTDDGMIEYVSQEPKILKKSCDYVNLLRQLGVSGSLAFAVSLLNVHDMYLADGRGMFIGSRPVDQQDIRPKSVELPPTVDGSDAQLFARLLRPIFDHIWRSTGSPGNPHFDAAGNYRDL